MRSYLRSKTHQPAFLWRLGIGILMVGAVLGYAAQWLPESFTDRLQGDFADLRAHVDQQQRLAEQGDWGLLWWGIPRSMWLGLAPGATAIAAVTGLCWFVFTVQAGQPGARGGIRWPLALIAVALGVASIWPTLFAVYWQEEVWGLEKTEDLIGGLRFYILGVGLREELSKLLLLLPLLPWIVRRGSEREALLISACVGLGFAMEENAMYLAGDAGRSVPRFLTANFAHMSLTGLAGLAVCRGVWHPRERGPEAAAIVLLVIIVHGLYDATLMPVFGEYSILGYILYILLAYQFFRELRRWWQQRGQTISLTATFITAVSLVAAVTFVYVSATNDFNTALDQVVQPGIASGLLVYVFLREVPESLVDV
ncbi:MAG: PrsW family glutamic-type intramembrane protease [Aeoliella sp.]